MKIHEIMSDKVVTIAPEEPVSAAAKLLKQCNVGSLPVCDGKGRLRGMITDRDIVLRCVAAEEAAGTTPVRRVMSRHPWVARPGDDIRAAAETMKTAFQLKTETNWNRSVEIWYQKGSVINEVYVDFR